MPSEKYEAMRLQTQRKLDQLVMRLDAKEPRAIKESRAILAKIVIDGNPLLLADVLRGMVGRLDGMQNAIDIRRRSMNRRRA